MVPSHSAVSCFILLQWMVSIAWTLLSKICLWDDFRSSDPKKSGWCNFATSEVFARPKFWKVFCLIHDCLCTGDCKKYSIHFLHRKSHISQGECDSISQIATKTKQMLPFLTINCPTSLCEKYQSSEIGKIRAWNREQPLLIWPLHREITMESGEWILQLKKLEIWIEADASFGSVWLSLSSPH